ncbi:hypothetical protein HYS54_00430 [Candidatus Micrarchaeota archaeon]|nr:hypothetical protein [Candidatus Micrarchaeota archaeon]
MRQRQRVKVVELDLSGLYRLRGDVNRLQERLKEARRQAKELARESVLARRAGIQPTPEFRERVRDAESEVSLLRSVLSDTKRIMKDSNIPHLPFTSDINAAIPGTSAVKGTVFEGRITPEQRIRSGRISTAMRRTDRAGVPSLSVFIASLGIIGLRPDSFLEAARGARTRKEMVQKFNGTLGQLALAHGGVMTEQTRRAVDNLANSTSTAIYLLAKTGVSPQAIADYWRSFDSYMESTNKVGARAVEERFAPYLNELQRLKRISDPRVRERKMRRVFKDAGISIDRTNMQSLPALMVSLDWPKLRPKTSQEQFRKMLLAAMLEEEERKRREQ